jgi:hypothetical protein
MDGGGEELDRFLEKIEDAMPQQAALREAAAAASLQLQRNPRSEGMGLLHLYDELIALVEFTQALVAEQPEGLSGATHSGGDPRVLGLNLDRLRARRDFWARLASHCSEINSTTAEPGAGAWQPRQM